MEINIVNYENRCYQVHFGLNKEKASDLFDSVKKIKGINDSLKEELFTRIVEDDLLDEALLQKGIIPIGDKILRYLLPYKVNQPLIGVTNVITIPESFDLALPKEIPSYIYQLIDERIKKLDEKFEDDLIDAGLFYEVSANKIDKNSEIRYNLRYTKDNHLLNEIKDQEFDLNYDDDFDSSLFIGKKVGDVVVMPLYEMRENNEYSISSELDKDINLEVVIKEIKTKVLYNEDDYSLERIMEYGFDTFLELYNNYMELNKEYIKTHTIVEFFVDYAQTNTKAKIDRIIIEYYKAKAFYPYCFDDNKDQLKQIKKAFIFDILYKMATLNKPPLRKQISNIIKLNDTYYKKSLHGYDDYAILFFELKEKQISDYLIELELFKN